MVNGGLVFDPKHTEYLAIMAVFHRREAAAAGKRSRIYRENNRRARIYEGALVACARVIVARMWESQNAQG